MSTTTRGLSERAIERAVRQAINTDPRRRATLVRNAVGFDAVTNTRYGLGLGSADLVGILHGSGRVFALEVKRPGQKPRPDQVSWIAVVRRRGGFAAVVTSVDEAMAALERACQGATA
jgi:hypothetical protein